MSESALGKKTAGLWTGCFLRGWRRTVRAFNVLRRGETRVGYLARALAADFAADALSPALRGIFPARHWPINSSYCDITFSLPPLFGPEPLSTASAKHVSQAGVWLTLAAAGTATAGAASAAIIAVIATVLALVSIVMSLPVYELRNLDSASIQVLRRHGGVVLNRSVK